MNRLTTDHPQNNFETVMNLVYGKDGWQYIRHGETEMRTTDFCLMLCKVRGCVALENPMSDEEKDEFLCDCAFNGCPIATIYAALSGFRHVRARLKRGRRHNAAKERGGGVNELDKQTSANYRRYSRKADRAHSRLCIWLSIPGRKRKM